jgi:hypothetical protein
LNIVADAYLPEIQDALEPYIYEVVGGLPDTSFIGSAVKQAFSIAQGIDLCRAWNRSYENSCTSIFQECDEHWADEEN